MLVFPPYKVINIRSKLRNIINCAHVPKYNKITDIKKNYISLLIYLWVTGIGPAHGRFTIHLATSTSTPILSKN